MGNILSSASTNQVSTSRKVWSSDSEAMDSQTNLNDNSDNSDEQFHDTVSDDEDSRSRAKEEEMIEFRKQLNIKREQRREILARHKSDKLSLEESFKEERKAKLKLYEENRQFRELLLQNNIALPENLQDAEENYLFKEALAQLTSEIENQKTNNNRLRCDLANSNKALQAAYSDMAELSAQNSESIKQIQALKDVVSVSKTMISLREDQLTELKNKLAEIEQSLADREASMLSTDLRQEYERQLQNIRTLRGLYEERARLAEVTRQALARDLEEQKALYEAEILKCNDLTTELEESKSTVASLEETIEDKNNEIFACKDEMNGIKSEMAVVNKLFSQVLLGYKTKRDLDKLVQRLEENHGILTHMAEKENDSEASSALPKLLLEIVNQVDDSNKESNEIKSTQSLNDQREEQGEDKKKAEEIVQNLPKVWRVLIELLSHQGESNSNESEKVTTCYKSVETKSGPVLVPSVSQTYIRLKDLIVEKLSLVKEVNRMKQLNSHLENRLQEQERRLCFVTTELSKTWHVVGRLRRHHHQLHTHEKILKYELQQKRKLLNELKEELEYCREKWEQAREKNSQSEKDWKKLRAEFSSRKLNDSSAINTSAESGYSDEKVSDESSESNNESDYIPGSKIKSKKKIKKSFETAVDSSTDINLAAERDDPVSDMIDVADLSLDTQDESQDILDDSSCSENLLRSEKLFAETEDEATDIGNDSYCEENSTTEAQNSNVAANTTETESNLCDSELHALTGSQSLISSNEVSGAYGRDIPTTSQENVSNVVVSQEDSETSDNKFKNILMNIQKQNERLQLKDQKLEKLENECSEIVSSISNAINKGQILKEKLNLLHGKYSNETQENNIDAIEAECSSNCIDNKSDTTSMTTDIETPTSTQILNNNSDLDSIDNNELKSESVSASLLAEIQDDNHQNIETIQEASTSSDLNHEARFAARDERLKRLEEQTKSLVSKVNNTKGVKINYKLEELHQIYVSDHSRSGTPSEDAGENSQSNDEEKENEPK